MGFPSFFPCLVVDKRQQSNDARAFDGNGQLTLMLCASARHAARQNLSALRYIAAQPIGIFIIDDGVLSAQNAQTLRLGRRPP